jgi:hypothetical protein
MRFKHSVSLLLAGTFVSALLMSGCAVHARVYDPYYHDYHGVGSRDGLLQPVGTRDAPGPRGL